MHYSGMHQVVDEPAETLHCRPRRIGQDNNDRPIPLRTYKTRTEVIARGGEESCSRICAYVNIHTVTVVTFELDELS